MNDERQKKAPVTNGRGRGKAGKTTAPSAPPAPAPVDPVPPAPDGTGAAGLRLWRSVLTEYELDEHELALLVEAVRTVDGLTALDAAVRRDGTLIDSPQGMRAHPALKEARQQRIALARLLAALRLPLGDESSKQESARPQRRVGVRGTYGIRGVVS